MNVVVACVACAIVLLGVIGFYFATIGVKANLVNASIGQVYSFDYVQPHNGERRRVMAKVLDVYRMDDSSIRRLNRFSNYRRDELVKGDFQRSNHLVTCQTPDGNIRQFYAERTENCRRPLIAV